MTEVNILYDICHAFNFPLLYLEINTYKKLQFSSKLLRSPERIVSRC
jgi:hypothetical protein